MRVSLSGNETPGGSGPAGKPDRQLRDSVELRSLSKSRGSRQPPSPPRKVSAQAQRTGDFNSQKRASLS